MTGIVPYNTKRGECKRLRCGDFMEIVQPFPPLVMDNLNRSWERVFHLGTHVSLPGKSVITGRSPGIKEHGIYYIKRGRVRLSSVTIGGQEKMLLYMGEATLFNEIPMLIVSSDYMFTTMEDTDAVFWTRKQITTDFTREYPELVLNLMETMALKMQSFFMQLCGMSSCSSFVNVCRILCSMYVYQRKNGVVVPSLSKQELAAFLGIHRSSLHKALSRLQDEGVIGSYTRSRLEIQDLDKLKKYAEQLIEP